MILILRMILGSLLRKAKEFIDIVFIIILLCIMYFISIMYYVLCIIYFISIYLLFVRYYILFIYHIIILF